MNNFSDLFRGIENLIRAIPWMRFAMFAVIGLMAVLEYVQNQNPSAVVGGVISILGIVKSLLPSNTARMPNGEVVSTLRVE